MLLCECVRVYCFFTVLPVYVLLCAAYGVIKNDDDDSEIVSTKSCIVAFLNILTTATAFPRVPLEITPDWRRIFWQTEPKPSYHFQLVRSTYESQT